MRLYHKEFTLQFYIKRDSSLLKSSYPAQFDRQLGYIPKPGFDSTENIWNKKVTIIEDGIRSNDNNVPLKNKAPLILAVGDSFTFGDEVENNETWPAYLEAMTKTKTLNGGVFGYGLDQMLIRAETLHEKYKPDILIVSFFADGIGRCELENRTNTPKPYFRVKDDKLVLNTSHITDLAVTSPHPAFDFLRNIFGYSLFAHRVMSKNAPTVWYYGTTQYWKKTGENPEKVACLLMGRLKDFSARTGVKVLLLAQYQAKTPQKNIDKSARLIKCASDAAVETLDLLPVLSGIKTKDPERYGKLFVWHMSASGNRFVAQELKKYMESKGWI